MTERVRGPRGDPQEGRDPLVPVLRDFGTFPRPLRVLHSREFRQVQRRGARIRTPWFTVIAVATDGGHARLGLAVSKKVGSAVRRNRIKRLLRELFRRTARQLPSVDLVVIAEAGSAQAATDGLKTVGDVVLPAMGKAAASAIRRKARQRR